MRALDPVPERLVDPSWGDAFPAGVPTLARPDTRTAARVLDAGRAADEGQLLYGWFAPEEIQGRTYRWASRRAAALIRLGSRSRRLRLEYAHVPRDIGEVEVAVRRVGSADPLAADWSTRLAWQYIGRSVENHPIDLAPGLYEIVFSAARTWSDPPRETRPLAFALARAAFEQTFDVPAGGIDMARDGVEDQLVSGWYEGESEGSRSYRWASARAAAVVRLPNRVSGARVVCRMPPRAGAVVLSLRPLAGDGAAHSTRIQGAAGEWCECRLELDLAAGDYLAEFAAEQPWSNPAGRDPELWPEDRVLGVGVSVLSFEPVS
jgi:hypothetical protein